MSDGRSAERDRRRDPRRTSIPRRRQLVDGDAAHEDAILVAAPTKDVTLREAHEHLEELGRLANTAGATPVGIVRQRLSAPNPKFYIGEGKARELRETIAEKGATLVLFDEELTPAQGKNLEDYLDVRIMDRAELILDIFATRARTREAKLQVELAQLEYLLPRLTRMWNHLSRTRGGIGLRGPGETQLETDRRIIGDKIAELRRKLDAVTKARATQRKSREGAYRAALVGYTNAGKSSILNALADSDLFVEDRLFATLDPTTRSVELGDGYEALLTDTVGFLRKLPHHLVASFRSTLEEAREAHVLLQIIDAAHADWVEHKRVVEEALDELDLLDRPVILVFNKVDRLTHEEEAALRHRVQAKYDVPAVFVSAFEAGTLGSLRDALKARVRGLLSEVTLRVPAGDGEALAALHREGEVVSQENGHGAELELTARIPEALLGRLRDRPGIRVMGRS